MWLGEPRHVGNEGLPRLDGVVVRRVNEKIGIVVRFAAARQRAIPPSANCRRVESIAARNVLSRSAISNVGSLERMPHDRDARRVNHRTGAQIRETG
jgi:hypothetical protein